MAYDPDDPDDYLEARWVESVREQRQIQRICRGTAGLIDPPEYDDEVEEDEETTGETSIVTTVTARKSLYVGASCEIRPGDRVRVTTGFTYEKGGPRTGYFRQSYRVAKGPAWA
jgi:hypothetical protein